MKDHLPGPATLLERGEGQLIRKDPFCGHSELVFTEEGSLHPSKLGNPKCVRGRPPPRVRAPAHAHRSVYLCADECVREGLSVHLLYLLAAGSRLFTHTFARSRQILSRGKIARQFLVNSAKGRGFWFATAELKGSPLRYLGTSYSFRITQFLSLSTIARTSLIDWGVTSPSNYE